MLTINKVNNANNLLGAPKKVCTTSFQKEKKGSEMTIDKKGSEMTIDMFLDSFKVCGCLGNFELNTKGRFTT